MKKLQMLLAAMSLATGLVACGPDSEEVAQTSDSVADLATCQGAFYCVKPDTTTKLYYPVYGGNNSQQLTLCRYHAGTDVCDFPTGKTDCGFVASYCARNVCFCK